MLLQMAELHSFYGWVIFHCVYILPLSIHLSMDTDCFCILAIVNNAVMNIGCKYLFEIVFLPSNIYPEAKFLGHMVILFLDFWETWIIFFHSGYVNLHSHHQCTKVPFFPHLYQYVLFVVFLKIAILTGVRWYLIVVFICISLMTNVSVAHLCVFFGKISIQIFCPLFNQVFFFFFEIYLELYEFLTYFQY